MSRPKTTEMPLTFQARERLRDQQRQEASQLQAVMAAERRLLAEQEKAARLVEKAEAGVAARQSYLDAAVVQLVEVSGRARAAILLGRPEAELAGLTRARRRRRGPAGSDAGGSSVPA